MRDRERDYFEEVEYRIAAALDILGRDGDDERWSQDVMIDQLDEEYEREQ